MEPSELDDEKTVVELKPAPPGGRLLESLAIDQTVSALSVPDMIRTKLAAHIAKPFLDRLTFDFSDFQVLLTENELNREILERAKSNFNDIQVKQLIHPRSHKVAKIYNYSMYNIRGRGTRIKVPHAPSLSGAAQCLRALRGGGGGLWEGRISRGNLAVKVA